MTTSRSDQKPVPDGIVINQQGATQVEAERKRLGITPEELERRRNASLESRF